MHHVFVYGTLKRGFPNHGLLPEARFVGIAETRMPHTLVVAGEWFSPVLIAESGQGHHVEGELYVIDDAGLDRLDEVEGLGHGHGYERQRVEVVLRGDATIDAWVYVKSLDRLGDIRSEPLKSYAIDPQYVAGDARNQSATTTGLPD